MQYRQITRAFYDERPDRECDTKIELSKTRSRSLTMVEAIAGLLAYMKTRLSLLDRILLSSCSYGLVFGEF